MGNDLWRAAGIALTVAVFSVIGLLSGRQVKTKADYYVAGRRFGNYLRGGHYGRHVHWRAAALIGHGPVAFTNRFLRYLFSLGCFLALAGSGLFLLRRIRSGGQETIQEIVRGEYGRTAGALSTQCGPSGLLHQLHLSVLLRHLLVGSILRGLLGAGLLPHHRRADPGLRLLGGF
jgi:Na+/proline symporter